MTHVCQCVGRCTEAVDPGRGQRPRCHKPLRDTPVTTEQVREVKDVQSNLQTVSLAADVPAHILCDTEIRASYHRQEYRVSLRILAAMVAEVGVLVNERFPRRNLLGGRPHHGVRGRGAESYELPDK